MKFKYNKEWKQVVPLSGGKDSAATAIFLKDKIPDVEYIFCDTGSELKETYEYLDKLEKYLGKKITRLNGGRTFLDIYEKNGHFLPSAMKRWCTAELKIKPFEKYLKGQWVESYIGIRADENRKGYMTVNSKIQPRYPLMEEGIDLAGVNKILKDSGVGMPTYYEWRTRSGCYFCFFQRQIEWVGLLERHPELFEHAKQIEKMGYKGEGPKFTWIKGHPLEMIEERKEIIKEKYKRKLARQLEKEKKSKKRIEDVASQVIDEEGELDPCTHCHL